MTREIVQITGSGNVLYALCDDGSLWRLAPNKAAGADGSVLEWKRMERVPRDPPREFGKPPVPHAPRPDAAPSERAIKVR